MFTATEIARQVKEKKIKAVEVVEQCLKIIKEKDSQINAFLEVFEEESVQKARHIDDKIARGKNPGKLAGVPVAIKDNMLYEGHIMTCASKILNGYVCPYNATVVQKLIDEDAIIMGRTNMDEFAMGSSTENSAYKKTKNPANYECVPGGSSGGSAAAVSAGMVSVALGSDTGGSVRQPASFCGVYGLKPTYGSVSRYGLVAFASSLDQIGVFANSIEDAEIGFSTISGHDPNDSTSISNPNVRTTPDFKDIKIGIPKEYFIEGIDKEVKNHVLSYAKKLEQSGAKILDISLPHTKYAVPTYYIIASSEASSNLARYDGIRYGLSVKDRNDSIIDVYKKTRGIGFGPEVKRRIMLGTYSLSAGYYDAYYLKAQKIRTLIKNDFDKVFEKVDAILTPTSPSAAFKFGEKISDPISMYLSDIFTIPCNLAGLCGISIPWGKTDSGLPVGVQLLSRPFSEYFIFKLIKEYNRNL
jgi:aspartyl-tRNA(Asn)/glutamyl-tRNA(Gln) amidotransferase subunit A